MRTYLVGCVSCSSSKLCESYRVDVVDVVARQMVARVVRRVGEATVQLAARHVLVDLGTGKQTSSRDAVLVTSSSAATHTSTPALAPPNTRSTYVDEGKVVRAAVKGRHAVRQAVLRKEVNKDVGDGGRGVADLGCRARAVVDAAIKVRRAQHVEVDHDGDLRQLLGAQRRHIVLGAQQAELLGAEPTEAHFVGGREAALVELQRDLERRRAAAAIIVDSRTSCSVDASDDG